ncbi:6-phosphogluconate dehydrogenase [Fusarium circinatum]|uniref:phosphogluconate dehydrogenase (NADP(+)-dependent, decarboxylating) n=1 Tax=Fusarium circinatum TaxID=48490 RepID=A0A8H5T494_FUSCI|nr:6-phosphogluconate dehydrogenase [Fusarium circinatum]
MKAAEKTVKDVYSENHPRIIIFSIPHGNPGDECVKALRPYRTKGYILLGSSNEFYGNTERRQADLSKMALFMSDVVSGDYQSARASPLMSPGGALQSLEIILPLLGRVAAKDRSGKSCTSPICPGDSGQRVKMIYNGIEQGMMSVVAEVWDILTKGLQLSYDEAAGVFEKWNQTPEHYNTFLIYIAVDINKTKDQEGRYVLGRIQDNVVQYVDNTEGTGTWSSEEAVRLHIPATNIVSAHLFRCTSAELSQRAADDEASRRWQPSAMKVASKVDFYRRSAESDLFLSIAVFHAGSTDHSRDRSASRMTY